MNKALFALALGTFALGLAEFQMMGILVELANAMHVSVSVAGHFIAAYALGVCVGAPCMLFFRRMRLSTMLLMLVAIIFIGNTMAAVSTGFWGLVISRFVSGLPHGAYFGVGAIIARKLARPGHDVEAVSYMIAGMTVATVVGVPLGTLVSEMMGWRFAFVLVSLAGIATWVCVRRFVRVIDPLPNGNFKSQFNFLRTLPPWLIFGGVIFAQIGLYCWYSYVDPQLTREAGFNPSNLPWLMAVGGLGMFVGNLVSGQLGIKYKPSLVASAIMVFGAMILLLIYFLGCFKLPDVILVFFGAAALFGSGSPLQSSIVGYSKGGELLGGACIQIAYNAGNAIAAAIGGAVIASTDSYNAPALAGLPLVVIGAILVAILYIKVERRQTSNAG